MVLKNVCIQGQELFVSDAVRCIQKKKFCYFRSVNFLLTLVVDGNVSESRNVVTKINVSSFIYKYKICQICEK